MSERLGAGRILTYVLILFFALAAGYIMYPLLGYFTVNEETVKQDGITPVCSQTNLSLPSLSLDDKRYLIDLVHDAFSDHFKGRENVVEFRDRFDGFCNEVYVLIRVGGKTMVSASGKDANLAESAYTATRKAVGEGLCDATLSCYGNLSESDLSKLQVEVFILGGGKTVKDKARLYKGKLSVYGGEYEPGIHTIRLKQGGKTATYLSDAQVIGDIDTPKLMERLCAMIGLEPECAKRIDVSTTVYDTVHFTQLKPGGEVINLLRASHISSSSPTIAGVNRSLSLMNTWLTENLKSEGYFNYNYYIGSGRYSTANNMIRQLMASRVLAELSWTDEKLAEAHLRNLEYVFANWYREDGDKGYIYFDNKSKLGASAMALRLISASPYFEEYEDKAIKLANAIISLQKEDGSFKPWFIEPDYAYDEARLLTFYSGEALLALVEFYEATGDETILASALKSQDFYVYWYADELSRNYYPAYVPWQTMSLYKLYKITGDKKYVDAVFTINDELVKIHQVEKPVYLDEWGRWFVPEHTEYGSPHSSSTGVYTEGVTYAYELARKFNDSVRVERYGRSVRLGAFNIMNLQFVDPGDMYYLGRPERVIGGVKTGVFQNSIRVDTTQHASDAFTKILEVFDEDEFEG